MLISNHLALVRQVLQEPADSNKQRPYSTTPAYAAANVRSDVLVSLSSQDSQSYKGGNTGNSDNGASQYAKPTITPAARTSSQKLLEAMIDAMAGQTEFDNAGSIINTYV
jgi:hypothetical protein